MDTLELLSELKNFSLNRPSSEQPFLPVSDGELHRAPTSG